MNRANPDRQHLGSPPRFHGWKRLMAVRAALTVTIGVSIAGCQDIGSLLQRTAPELTSTANVLPARGPTLGGVEVTITGTNLDLQPGTQVLFGAFRGGTVDVVSASELRVTTPPQGAGLVDVIIIAADGGVTLIPAGYEYVAVSAADGEIIGQLEQRFPGAPKLVSAVSLNNTQVLVTFNEPVGKGADDPTHFSIVHEEVNQEVGVLLVRSAEPGDDRTTVLLSSFSQNDVLYRLTVTDIQDMAGNPIAPPEILDNWAQTTFPGLAAPTFVDSDGDGLSDSDEQRGWQVTLLRTNGQAAQRGVTSSPTNPDTDGDGLNDRLEKDIGSDPRSGDTDADQVTDAEEWNDWLSDPLNQDTDGDSLSDSLDLYFLTSPTLADTDGDQLSDADEIIQRNRNPRISDLPVIGVEVGDISFQLDERYIYTDQFGRTQSVQETFSDTVQSEAARSHTTQSSTTVAGHVDVKVYGKGGYDLVKQGWFEVGGEVTFGGSLEHTWGGSDSSSTRLARTYNEAVNRGSQLTSVSNIQRETLGARLAAAVTLKSVGDIAFTVRDVEISVLRSDPKDRSRLIPVATLVPNASGAGYNLGPLTPERGPFIFQNSDIFPSLVEELMSAPESLVFKVANYNITDEFGRNFSFSGQEVVERTFTLILDYGDGSDRAYQVAAASRFDSAGRALGISVEDALHAIGFEQWEGEDPELGNPDDPNDPRPRRTDSAIVRSYGMRTVTRARDEGTPETFRALSRIRGVQDDFAPETDEPNKQNDGAFWATLYIKGKDSNDGPGAAATTDFDLFHLKAGNVYALAYVKDTDGDELNSREEFFSRSSDTSTDSDRDDLPDYLEIRGQWNEDGAGAWFVYTDRLPGGYAVRPAPSMNDSDEDTLLDDFEYALCRYGYDAGGDPPRERYVIGEYDADDDPADDEVIRWEDDGPDGLPYAFAPSDGLPNDWHRKIDSATGLPVQFPSNRASLDPRKKDTDEDGLSDDEEVNGYQVLLFDDDPTDDVKRVVFVFTDPLDSDTDGDGLLDGMEHLFGTNPASTDGGVVYDDDLDGLPNRVEENGWLATINGVEHLVFSNPNDPDSDNDGLPDYIEWLIGTSPYYWEGQVVDPDMPAPGVDSDEDGIDDYDEWDGIVQPQDLDDLAFCDIVPNCQGYKPNSAAFGTDPVDADTDNDGISDGGELIDGWRVKLYGDPAGYEVFSNPFERDSDNDGWLDGQERAAGTDPNKVDTDGDDTADPAEASRVGINGVRNPLRPDQRVALRYLFLHPLKSGGKPGKTSGKFYFWLGARMPNELNTITWAHSWDADDLLGYPACSGNFGCQCTTCDGTAVQLYDGCTMNFSNLQFAERKFILAHGDIFSTYGVLYMLPSCGGFSFFWNPGGPGGESFTGPVVPKTATYDTGPQQTGSGEPIDLSIGYAILVD
ncbi:MAG: hypothetical protein CHACPFDD_03721 [Phycisphaerae bacterium]|nr:hypothetical protein [Phycisphaerae bacterium]